MILIFMPEYREKIMPYFTSYSANISPLYWQLPISGILVIRVHQYRHLNTRETFAN